MRTALLDWHNEHGRPPLSYAWAPTSNELAAQAPTEGMRRWQAEHPRWPSTTTVLRYFGSWSEALENAGLPVRRLLFDSSLEERVAAARRLAAAGFARATIAEQIGVTRGTVDTYLRSGRCAGCGTVIVQSASGLCRRCGHLRSSWTHEEILESIRDWARREGQPPTKREWTPSNARWHKEFPRWPTATIVASLFGGWNRALSAAGCDCRGRTWSAAEIVSALQAWAQANDGRPPAYGDWRTAGAGHPGVTVVAARFGSWRHAVEAAGLTPRHRRWTRESAVEAIQRSACAHEEVPSAERP